MKSKILFVDDEPRFLAALDRVLHSQQSIWEMKFARSVDEALEALRENDFDAVISDINMPEKDGFQLLDTLAASASTQDIPVVILTGAGDHNLKRQALTRGATDLLNKPVEPEDLLARLHSVLRLKSFQDQLKNHSRLLEEKVQERAAALEATRLDILLRLGKAAEYRDEETGNHILRVGCTCRTLAEELDMTPEFVELIFLASPLHDIGKIGIPDKILLKPGKLTASERNIMEQHCAIGLDILQQEPSGMKAFLNWGRKNGSEPPVLENPILAMASTIALSHHEKWDGSGYPRGLKGEEIPLAGRIVAVADVYDALRSERPYKPAYSEVKTLAIMAEQTGRHFDPMVFSAFKNVAEMLGSIHERFSDEMAGVEIGEVR